MLKITLKSIKHTLFLFSLIIAFSCSEEPVEGTDGVDGTNGFNALVIVDDEAPGENCSTGGVKISVGQDANENGALDSDEVASVSFVCNGSVGTDGSSGPTLFARTSPEEPGENCDAGGTLVEIGADINGNALLDDDEVQTSFFVCNGSDGADGGSGGENGLTSLIRATPSTSCSNGGITIEIGLDDDNNGTLDIGEVDATYDICNGADGSDGTNGSNGLNTLSNVITESPGANCANGGIRVQLGLDSNNNGILEPGEVVSDNYVCNGQNGSNGSDGSDGSDGISSITKATTEPSGSNCDNGGLRIDIGMDDINTDGILQNEEIDYTYYVCNGDDGANGSDGADGSDGVSTFVRTTSEPSGANCANGGVKIELGLDANGNQVFDLGEEFGSPIYVCNGTDGANGADGSDGSDGKSVIVTSAPAGGSCTNGGTTLTFGYDNNGDGDLVDSGIDEVLTTYTVCNGLNGNDGADGSDGSDGANGYNTIISTSTESPGVNCANGGLAITVGLDINRNNNIDTGEEVGTYYVCNGANGSNGQNSLVDIASFSGVNYGCTNGGLIIRTGIDDNGNGVLNIPGEVDDTQYLCNGEDGSDGQDGNSDNIFEFYFQEGFDGYTGVSDVSISDKMGTETGETFSVDRKPEGDHHGLIYFPEIDSRISEGIGGVEFEIVEAILYLRGRSNRIDGVTTDNFIGVKTLLPEAPLFDETRVTWTAANATENWQLGGVTNNSTDADANPYSDMFRLPHNITFDGFIPLLMNRTEIKAWADDKSNNKGLVLLMADDGTQYELDITSSENDKNTTYRPLLYIKVKTGVRGRQDIESVYERRQRWNTMTYEEKLAPLRNRD